MFSRRFNIEKKVAEDLKHNAEKFIYKMQNQWQIDVIDINKYALAKWRSELEDTIDDNFIKKAKINVEVELSF